MGAPQRLVLVLVVAAGALVLRWSSPEPPRAFAPSLAAVVALLLIGTALLGWRLVDVGRLDATEVASVGPRNPEPAGGY